MRLAEIKYTNTTKLYKEKTDVGYLAKMLESDYEPHCNMARGVLEGGLFYEVCSRDNGLYTKVKELTVVETSKGPRLAQTDVFLDGRVSDGVTEVGLTGCPLQRF